MHARARGAPFTVTNHKTGSYAMPKHLWMQDLAAVAYCPKCRSAAFKRSNTKSGYEKLIRRYTDKVPYRCHTCGYRSLVDQTILQFPASSQRQFEDHEDFTSDVELPNVRITTIMDNDSDKGKLQPNISAEKSDNPGAASPSEKSDSAGLEGLPGIPADALRIETDPADPDSRPRRAQGEALFPDFSDDPAVQDAVTMPMREGSKVHPASCPSCGEKALYRSHGRSVLESALKRISHRRLYRCHTCSWRGWLQKHA